MPYTEKALAAGRHMADVVVPHAAFRDALDLIANALDNPLIRKKSDTPPKI